jgi:hypothetical protein
MSKSSKSGAYQQHHLLNRAEEACTLLKEHLDKDHVVRVISHMILMVFGTARYLQTPYPIRG